MAGALRRSLQALGVLLGALVLVVAVLVWRLLHPAIDVLPLPPALIALDTPEGQALLETATKADLGPLSAHLETQSTASFCGVASGVAVLGALGQPSSQARFFEGPAGEVRSRLAVTLTGLTLEQLAAMLQAHGLAAEPLFASDLDPGALRRLLQDELAREEDALIANFYRPTLGEEGGGHHSPLAAYDAGSDRVLVLDTAAYKYPPTWVPLASLYAAMREEDRSSGRSRGLVRVRTR